MKIRTKIIAFILMLALACGVFPISSSAKGISGISAQSACLIEFESGSVLYSKNAQKRMPMASTTKIMTAIVAIESGIPLDTVVKTPTEAVGVEGSSIYLCENELITLESLLYGLLLCSANDAAVAIAVTVCGSVEKFVALMNEKAESLGLSDTHFTNPHGLYDEDHFTTALDLAHLMAYAMQSESFAAISGCEKRVFPKGEDGVRVMINHNRLLKTYDGVISGKTGFTKKSGRCLVSCAERDGMRLIAVTLNAPDDWNDHASLYDFGFESYERVVFDPISMKIPVISGQKSDISATSDPFSLLLPRERGNIEIRIEAPRFVFAEIDKNQVLGRIAYICDGKTLASVPLYSCETVAKIQYRFNLFEWLKDLFKGFIS